MLHLSTSILLQTFLVPILIIYADKPLIVENGAVCENKATGFFVVDNKILGTANSIVYKDTPEEDCITTCSTNRDRFGRSILCASFVYDHVSFTCTIFKEKAKPEGNADVVHVVGKRYFEKICLEEEVPKECADSQFIRADDFVLIGFARNVTLVETMEQCVAQCVKEKDCKSAMYFYEEGECITNTESALSKPNSFTREENEKVVYFQNGCLTKIQKQKNTFEPVLMESSSSTDSPADDIGEDVSEEYENEEGGNPEITQKSGGLAINDAEIGVKEVGGDEDYGTDKTPSDATISPVKKFNKKGEKASYIKYKKNPKNFESTTTIFTNEGEQSETAMKHEAHFDIAQDHPSSIIGSSVEEEIFTDTDKGDQLVQGQTSSFGEKHVNHETILETDEKAQNEDFPTYFSEWSEWTICKKAGERQIRRRKCLNLRRCIGALMQVRNCPAIVPEPAQSGPVQSIRSVVEVTRFPEYDDTKSDQSALETSSTISSETMWSPWFGVCQHFASAQPCNNGEMIGFESRECIAKEPNLCEGPFFRYCTLSC